MRNFDQRQVAHAAPLGLFARGFGKSGAEHVDGWDAAPLDLDGVGDIDRSRGAAIAKTQDHGIALRKTRHIDLAQPVLRRQLAHDRARHDREPIAELLA
jgi:hypothetical protein